MDKVKLPKLVAEGISNARELGFDNSSIILKSFETGDQGQWRNAIRDFAADNFDTFLKALVDGYEVKETPEDKVREKFNRLERYFNGDEQRQNDYQNGMHFVLEAFNIKVKGVNEE